MASKTSQVVIVGGGISGLSAAYDLARAGIPHTLIEKQPRLGGVIETRCQDGCVLECGPDSFLAAKPEALALIKELGLEGELIGSNDHQRTTYILKSGQLVPLPEGLMMMVPSRVMPMVRSPLLSWGTKFRMAGEILRRPRTYQDRSVAEFVVDHFGQETLDYLTEPLLAGVYGGDPRQLSAASVLPRFVEMERTTGSLGRAVMSARRPPSSGPLFRTLASGLGTLVESLAKYANVKYGEAQTIERSGAGYRVRIDDDWIEAANIIVATPAHVAAALLGEIEPQIAALLDEIPYSSSAIVSLIFDTATFDGTRAGFGFLVPKLERGRMAACTFVATKFPHRAPENRVVLRCFFGGMGDEEILKESDEQLLLIARDELRRILGLTAAPLCHLIARWPKSMAQYTVGHSSRVKEISDRVSVVKNLTLAGNAYDGIGIPDCVRRGRQAAASILRSETFGA